MAAWLAGALAFALPVVQRVGNARVLIATAGAAQCRMLVRAPLAGTPCAMLPNACSVGFGSLMVDNPERLTSKVVRAAQQAGVRLLIHKV